MTCLRPYVYLPILIKFTLNMCTTKLGIFELEYLHFRRRTCQLGCKCYTQTRHTIMACKARIVLDGGMSV